MDEAGDAADADHQVQNHRCVQYTLCLTDLDLCLASRQENIMIREHHSDDAEEDDTGDLDAAAVQAATFRYWVHFLFKVYN